MKRHRRNQSSCGGNKIFKADLGNEQGMGDANLMPQEGNLPSNNDMNEDPPDVKEIPYTGDGGDGYREKAICLDKAYKHYGKGGKKIPVLLDLDMSVEQGTIYGLLGKLCAIMIIIMIIIIIMYLQNLPFSLTYNIYFDRPIWLW